MQLTQIAIFGPGLIGGSLALATRRRALAARLAIWSHDAAERDAARRLELGEIITGDPAEAARDAELVVLCTPPTAMPALAERIAPHLGERAAVCDVASVKAGLTERLGAIFQRKHAGGEGAAPRSRFVGAHPMAGSERHGLSAARADLFERAVCLLTPEERTAPDALEIVRAFWSDIGARVKTLAPQEHDEAVGLVSHLPHVLATALVNFVSSQPEGGAALACAGSGWRDVTRIAGSSPELWTEILSHNRVPVTKALHGVIAKLREVIEHLEPGHETDLKNFLAEARNHRAGRASEEAPKPIFKEEGIPF